MGVIDFLLALAQDMLWQPFPPLALRWCLTSRNVHYHGVRCWVPLATGHV